MFSFGALMMVMKAKKIGNLYKLYRNTITGRVVTSTSAKPNCDDIILWHMRLGYLGEHNMFELHIWNLLKGVYNNHTDGAFSLSLFLKTHLLREQKKKKKQ